MFQKSARTAEHVSSGHPDKFCDQVADRILDETLRLTTEADAAHGTKYLSTLRNATECLVKDNLLIVSGEMKAPPSALSGLDTIRVARSVWRDVGYGDNWRGGYGDEDSDQAHGELTVINHMRSQSPNIGIGDAASAAGFGTGTDSFGAGDQGVMVGYATDETPEMMPLEYVLARDLCRRLHDHRVSGVMPWLRSDCKTQVSLDANGVATSVIVAGQHVAQLDGVKFDARDRKDDFMKLVVWPVLQQEISADKVCINGTGRFVIGGPTGDAGVVGRKIVVDAYGPRVPVGGGAYSGKDPSKVDRSAAYMCRHIARAVVEHKIGNAKECIVNLAFGIGRHQPEMVTAITDTGKDVSEWVKEKFKDLSPKGIIDRLELLYPKGWSYYETASYGHYGRSQFPWEKPANI